MSLLAVIPAEPNREMAERYAPTAVARPSCQHRPECCVAFPSRHHGPEAPAPWYRGAGMAHDVMAPRNRATLNPAFSPGKRGSAPVSADLPLKMPLRSRLRAHRPTAIRARAPRAADAPSPVLLKRQQQWRDQDAMGNYVPVTHDIEAGTPASDVQPPADGYIGDPEVQAK